MQTEDTLFGRIANKFRPPNPSFHYSTKKINILINQYINQGKKVLDLGSGGRRLRNGIISLDIDKGVNVDIVANAEALPFRQNAFDFIICTAVLEHVADYRKAVFEMNRCLLNSGLIYVEVPFLQTYHAHPNDFRRFTLAGLEYLFRDYKKRDSGVCVGPFSILAWIFRKFPRFLFHNSILGLGIEFIFGWLTFWIKYLDIIVPNAKRAHQIASGIYFLGQKSNTP